MIALIFAESIDFRWGLNLMVFVPLLTWTGESTQLLTLSIYIRKLIASQRPSLENEERAKRIFYRIALYPRYGGIWQKEGSGRGLNPGPLASCAIGCTLSENHTTRPPDRAGESRIRFLIEVEVCYLGICC